MPTGSPSFPVMLPPSEAAAHHLLVRVEFTAPVLSRPVFAADAAWLARLGSALERAKLDAGPVLARITLAVPFAGDGLLPAAEEPDANFVPALIDILARRGLLTTENGISIRESLEPRDGLLVEVAIYGQPR